jgi:hypothetical protein
MPDSFTELTNSVAAVAATTFAGVPALEVTKQLLKLNPLFITKRI